MIIQCNWLKAELLKELPATLNEQEFVKNFQHDNNN